MLPEIAAAVGFLSSLLRTRGCVSEQRLKVFSGALQEALTGERPPWIQARRASGLCPALPGAAFLSAGAPRAGNSDSVSLQPGRPAGPRSPAHVSLPGPARRSRPPVILGERCGHRV